MTTVKLDNPITVDGISVSELTIRRPKVRDYLAIERLNGSDLSKEVTLTANLTSVAKEAIEELDIADYVKIQEVLKDFFFTDYPKNLRLEILVLGSIIGGGVEHILDMEISEFILWSKLAREFKCQYYR
ncbi:phage tail assembly protein [Wolbachia endosymbiont (group B) of Xanthorhoe designata]|uniref:phage tail assembly protein n=1 Tax=Wolbachia endosymbiont (group B) of Xanthorhoe designata TaxID=3066184 RepID=UPI0033420CB0